jgi:hypothetical protein
MIGDLRGFGEPTGTQDHPKLYDAQGREIWRMKHTYPWHKRILLWAPLIFSATLTIATVFYTIYAHHQWSLMKANANDTSRLLDLFRAQVETLQRNADATKSGAAAAVASAEAAEKGTRIAAQALEMQAPYLAVESIKLRREAENDAVIQILFNNRGQTPARNLKYEYEYKIDAGGKITTLKYKHLVSPALKGEIVAPSRNTAIDIEVHVGGRFMDTTLSEALAHFSVDGTLHYQDRFGAFHESEFCYFYVPTTESFNPCIVGNDFH